MLFMIKRIFHGYMQVVAHFLMFWISSEATIKNMLNSNEGCLLLVVGSLSQNSVKASGEWTWSRSQEVIFNTVDCTICGVWACSLSCHWLLDWVYTCVRYIAYGNDLRINIWANALTLIVPFCRIVISRHWNHSISH